MKFAAKDMTHGELERLIAGFERMNMEVFIKKVGEEIFVTTEVPNSSFY